MNYLYRIRIDKKKENKNDRFNCFYFIFKIRYSLNKNNNNLYNSVIPNY